MNKTESIYHNQNLNIVSCKQIKVIQTNTLISCVTDQSSLIRKLEYAEDKGLLRDHSHFTATTNLGLANHLCKAHRKPSKQE